MRSSPSGRDPLDPGPKGFAHRGLHDGSAIPENSLIAFAAALEAGAGIECDLRLTADDRVIVFHDADAWRMCGTSVVIRESSFADLRQLRLGDAPLPTLESMLELVAGRAPLLLEVKVDRDIWRWPHALASAISGYAGPFGVMSFDPRIPRLLKTNLPNMRRGLVIRDNLSPLRRRLALWLAGPHFIAVEKSALGKPWVEKLRGKLPVYSWTVRTADERRQAQVHADALIWEADGRPRS
jgi:glycerophosphoryl diester phosphodiesterase